MLLNQMMKAGADLSESRHVLYYLYFPSEDAAGSAAGAARDAGFTAEVRKPLDEYPDQWTVVCEQQDVVLSIDFIRDSDDLFESIAAKFSGEYDGWEASM